jgi:hypothetical protein
VTIPAVSRSFKRFDNSAGDILGTPPEIIEASRAGEEFAQQKKGPSRPKNFGRHRHGTELIIAAVGHDRAPS